MLLEILFSLTLICDFSLRIFPMKALMTYNNMGTYLILPYFERKQVSLFFSGYMYKRLILFPREVYLKGERACLWNMHVAYVYI